MKIARYEDAFQHFIYFKLIEVDKVHLSENNFTFNFLNSGNFSIQNSANFTYQTIPNFGQSQLMTLFG